MALRIRELRKQRSLTIDQLADMTGYSRGFISQIETGKRIPSGRTLVAIAQALATDVPNLYDAGDIGDELAEMIALLRGQPREAQRAALRVIQAMRPEPTE